MPTRLVSIDHVRVFHNGLVLSGGCKQCSFPKHWNSWRELLRCKLRSDCFVSGCVKRTASVCCIEDMAHGKGERAFSSDDVEDLNTREDLETTARRELGETTEVKQKSLEQLRQLLAGEQSLKIPPGDEFLVMFLRTKKYRVEDTFRMIKKFFRVQRDTPEFFRDLVPSKVPLRTICRENTLLMISPTPDSSGRITAIMRLGAWNSDICTMTDLARAVLLVCGSWIRTDIVQIMGVSAIADLKGLNFHHVMHLTPSFIMKIAHITQECWPTRIKAIYVINHPSVFEVIFAAAKPFLKNKLLSRIHFVSGDVAEFWKSCPPDFVPKEFGGVQEFDHDCQEAFVESNSDFFEGLCRSGYRKN